MQRPCRGLAAAWLQQITLQAVHNITFIIGSGNLSVIITSTILAEKASGNADEKEVSNHGERYSTGRQPASSICFDSLAGSSLPICHKRTCKKYPGERGTSMIGMSLITFSKI